jgi:PAS domain S-box-containing protein
VDADTLRATLARVLRRRRLVTEIRQSEARLASILDTAVDAIITIDERGIVQSVNSAAVRLFGYEESEIVGQNVKLLMPSPDRERHDTYIQNYLKTGEKKIIGIGREVVGLRNDGSQFAMDLAVSEVRLGDRRLFTGMVRDISQQKQAELRARQAERLAAIGQTVTGLAHESRNAFQRSQACLEMLAMELDDRPEALELVERTQKALDDLHHLYEEVRDYAAPIVLDRQVCDLAHVWRDSWSHLRQAHGEKGVHLIERADGVDLACQVDWFAMGQVFRNVLENAIAACPVGGRIVVHCREVRLLGQSAVEVAIRDDGPGFDPANRDKVFDPFFTTKVKGTGLGMAIARRIVEAHGGQITLGENGPGAEVILTLPRGV